MESSQTRCAANTAHEAGEMGSEMADRKQFQNVSAPDPELMRLLDESRKRVVTEEELREQRVSFAFGNAPESELITKDSVRAASTHIRLLR
jgi:hypothetical protein